MNISNDKDLDIAAINESHKKIEKEELKESFINQILKRPLETDMIIKKIIKLARAQKDKKFPFKIF